MWQVIAKSIQTFFEMRILHTFFKVDQERAWNVYVGLWYEKNEKRALTPFFVAIVVANAEKKYFVEPLEK